MLGLDWLTGDVLGAGVGLLAGAAGSSGGGSTQSTTLDPRMAQYVYGPNGNDGLLADMQSIYQQQIASGGLNDMQKQGMGMQYQYLTSPQYLQGSQSLYDVGAGLLNGGIAGNPFNRSSGVKSSQGGGSTGFQFSPVSSGINPAIPVRGQTSQTPTEKQPTKQPGIQPGQGGNTSSLNNIGGANSALYGGGQSTNPGGQGIGSQTEIGNALAAMGIGQNMIARILAATPALAARTVGGMYADKNLNGMSAAASKLAANQDMAGSAMGTVSDQNGNVRTYSSPSTIAAQDADMNLGLGYMQAEYGPGRAEDGGQLNMSDVNAAQLARALGGGYGRLGTFGRNNMAGDASGMGFGGQSGFGGFGTA